MISKSMQQQRLKNESNRIQSKLTEAFQSVQQFYKMIASWNDDFQQSGIPSRRQRYTSTYCDRPDLHSQYQSVKENRLSTKSSTQPRQSQHPTQGVQPLKISALQTGNGTIQLENGWVYQGEYVNGLFHGYGELSHDGKLIYSGNFYNGYFHGYGKLQRHVFFQYLFQVKDSTSSFRQSQGDREKAIQRLEWMAYFGQFRKGSVTGVGEIWLYKCEQQKVVGIWKKGQLLRKSLLRDI